MSKKSIYTTYAKAVKWINTNLVLCNNVPEIDDTIWDNFTRDIYDEDGQATEIYQWYITDCSQSDVEWLTKSFDLLFTYSEKLDCYILAVDHYGTSWGYVPCEVLSKEMKEIIVRDKLTYKDLTKQDI